MLISKVTEIEKFMSEFEVFFGQIYIMEKRNTSASVAERIYMESKIFVGSGDGYRTVVNAKGVKEQSMISFNQAVEVISNYSSGMFSIKKVYDEINEFNDVVCQ